MSEILPPDAIDAGMFRKHALAAMQRAETAAAASHKAEYLAIAVEWLKLAEAAEGSMHCRRHIAEEQFLLPGIGA